MSATLQLAEHLISRPSVTPEDGDCQQIIGRRLEALGFALETIESGPPDFRVTNLWAVRTAHAGRVSRPHERDDHEQLPRLLPPLDRGPRRILG